MTKKRKEALKFYLSLMEEEPSKKWREGYLTGLRALELITQNEWCDLANEYIKPNGYDKYRDKDK